MFAKQNNQDKQENKQENKQFVHIHLILCMPLWLVWFPSKGLVLCSARFPPLTAASVDICDIWRFYNPLL